MGEATNGCDHKRRIAYAELLPRKASVPWGETLKVHAVGNDDDLFTRDAFHLDNRIGGVLRDSNDSLAPPCSQTVNPPCDAWQVLRRRTCRREGNRYASPRARNTRCYARIVEIRMDDTH